MSHDYHPWTVRHFNHAGQALGEAFPQNLAFGKFLGLKVGHISYTLSMDQDLAVRSKTDPYITDWKLLRGHEGAMVPLLGGMHTNIEINEVEGRSLQVAGKDWKHWFEKDEWPFDPTNPVASDYHVTNRDIALIVDDILDTVLAQPNSPSFSYTLAAIGQTTNWKIEPADTEKIINKLDALSKLDPGFDLEITHDREIILHSPQQGNNTGFALRQGHNIENLRYAESGPRATQLRAYGQATTRIGKIVNDASQPFLRRLVESVEFSEVKDQAALDARALAEAARMAAPTIEFSCSYVTSEDDKFWKQVDVGDSLPVYAELEYDTIDDEYRLVGIECNPTDEGDEEIVLTFDDGSLSL